MVFSAEKLTSDMQKHLGRSGFRLKTRSLGLQLTPLTILIWIIPFLGASFPAWADDQRPREITPFPADNADKSSWQDLFNGRDLTGWEIVERYEYSSHGKVFVTNGCLYLEAGQPGTAVRWKKEFPRINYELVVEAKKTGGNDFFCGLTFPVKDKFLTLIVGGWGGSVVGLSLIDGEPASENETCRWVSFELDRWYQIRLRVTETSIKVWLDDEQLVSFDPRGRRLSLRWESEPCAPLGLATWKTSAAYRCIRFRLLDSEEISACEQ
jgi:hypothetical protein